MLDRPSTVFQRAFADAFDAAIGPVGTELSRDELRLLVAAAEQTARAAAVDQVAGQLHADAQRWAEQLARRRADREREQAERDRAERDARKTLKRIPGGSDVDPLAEYWLVSHPVGQVAYRKSDEDLVQPPPVVRGKRAGQRGVTGAELAAVEGLAGVVADAREARALLDRLARERNWSPEPVGAGIVEDPE